MLLFLAFLVVVLFVVIVVLLTRTSDISSKLQELRREVARLAGRVLVLEGKDSTAPIPHRPTEEIPQPVAEQLQAHAEVPPPSYEQLRPPEVPEVIPPTPLIVPSPPKPSRTREEWEALIGGKLLNRIGSLALIIGVGFFLKYAFDKDWITEWMRVAVGGLAGTAILLLASRSKRKGLEIFAQGLVGAGIAILYLSVYASFNFYSLVSQPVAFGLMSCVTAIAFTQAFKYDSLAVSLLGWIGGFLTPFLLSTGEANAVGLFTYIALLDVAVLAVLFVKDRWIVLLPLTLVGTYVIYYLWYEAAYRPDNLWTAVTFLSIFWALFHLLDTAWCIAKRMAFREARRWGSVVNVITYYAGFYAVLDQGRHDWLAAATLIVGIAYALSAMVIQRRAPTERIPVVQNTITAILLLVGATYIQFETYTIVMVYALEAVALGWVGRRWNLNYVWYAASAVLLLGVLVLLTTPGALHSNDAAHFTVLFTYRVAAYLSLIVGAGLVLWMARSSQAARGETLRAGLHLAWVLITFILITVECSDYFSWLQATVADRMSEVLKLDFQRMMAEATLWILFSVPLVAIGKRKSIEALLIPGLVIAAMALTIAAIRGSSFFPVADFQIIMNIRCGVLVLVSMVFLLYGRSLTSVIGAKGRMSDLLHYAWIALMFILCTAETVDFFRQRALLLVGGGVAELAFMRFMVLGGVWTIYAVLLEWIGVRTHIVPMVSASLWVIILAALIAGLRGIAYDPVQAYLPVLNVRVAIILVVIGGLNWFLRELREDAVVSGWGAEFRSTMRVLTIVLTLVLITGEIRDFFEKGIQTGGNEETSRQLENLKQLLLSSSWLIYSILLMVYGIWRRTRLLRMISIGLFGIAILKIFIYDLSFLDTLYRIFSFLGLGIILLAVSYLYQRYRDLILGGGIQEVQKG